MNKLTGFAEYFQLNFSLTC